MSALLSEPVVGVVGGGGFGKTTLLATVCGERALRRRFPGGLYWVTLGEDACGAALAGLLNDVTEQLGAPRPALTNPQQAGFRLGQVLAEMCGRALLVVDDVWSAGQLTPFLLGGEGCTRVAVGRNRGCLPARAAVIEVPELSRPEAEELLGLELPAIPLALVSELLELTARHALLVRLANRYLHRACADGAAIGVAAGRLAARIARGGPVALDHRGDRHDSVAATLGASVEQLDPASRRNFGLLAVFPEDTDIPLDVLRPLWGTDAERLCEELRQLSLVASFRQDSQAVRLHDVVRRFLRMSSDVPLPQLNRQLLEAAGLGENWESVPVGSAYVRRHLGYHLDEAGLSDRFRELVLDLRWIVERIRLDGVVAAEEDLERAGTPEALVLKQTLSRNSHLLAKSSTAALIGATLLECVSPVPELASAAARFRRTYDSPRLATRWHYPGPSVVQPRRIFSVESTWRITALAVSPDGGSVAIVDRGGLLAVHSSMTGELVKAFGRGGERMTHGAAFTADGTGVFYVDDMIRLIDLAEGTERFAVPTPAHVEARFVVDPAGDWVAVADATCGGGTVLDARTGQERFTFRAQVWCETVDYPGPPLFIAPGPEPGSLLAAGPADPSIRLLSASDGSILREFPVSERIGQLAVDPRGRWLARVAWGLDHLRIQLFDPRDGRTTLALPVPTEAWTTPTELVDIVVAPDGGWLAALAAPHLGGVATVIGWDTRSGEELFRMPVVGRGPLASGPDGSWLATTSRDCVYLWERPTTATAEFSCGLNDVAVDSRGRWLAATPSIGAADKSVRFLRPDDGRLIEQKSLGSLFSPEFGPDGSWLLSTGRGAEVFIVDWRSGSKIAQVMLPDVGLGRAVLPDGTVLLMPELFKRGRHVHKWDPAAGSLDSLFTLEGGRRWATSPGGEWLAATGRTNRSVEIWNLRTRTLERSLIVPDCLEALEYRPHHGQLVSLDEELLLNSPRMGVLRLWDPATGAQLSELAGLPHSHEVAVSPDGTMVVARGNQKVTVWRFGPAGEFLPYTELRVDSSVGGVTWLADSSGLCLFGRTGIRVLSIIDHAHHEERSSAG